MSLKNFDGNTFVAFVDISGFEKKVKNNLDKAMDILNFFYNTGYNLLKNINNNFISGIFVSDCAILYINIDNTNASEYIIKEQFKNFLNIIKELNKNCINENIMLTTNIAYGKFKYNEKFEIENIQKGAFAGNAYIAAFAASEGKMDICGCRILKENVPFKFEQLKNDSIITSEKKYWHFWWQCKTEEKVNIYMKRYKEIKKQYKGKDKVDEKFDKLCELTKNFSNETEQN